MGKYGISSKWRRKGVYREPIEKKLNFEKNFYNT